MMGIGKGRRSISSGGLVARRHKTLVTSPNHSVEDLNMYLKPIGNLSAPTLAGACNVLTLKILPLGSIIH